MKLSSIESRQQWLAARLDLLAQERAASRQLTALVEYNYKDKATLHQQGLDYVAANGSDGISVFVQDAGTVYHPYSAYGVGADVTLSTYRFLDLTPLGRQRYINEWPWRDGYETGDHDEHHH